MKFLVLIVLLTPFKNEYLITVIIIPKREGTMRFITDFNRLNKNLMQKP